MTAAVREALSQLLEYEHFLVHRSKPQLVALFTEPIGESYIAFLQGLSIDSVWLEDQAWCGTTRACADGIADRIGALSPQE